MTTMWDLVADTRRLAYGSMSDQLNFLAVEAPEGAGELTFMMSVDSISPGMVLSSGLNVYYVISTAPGTKTVQVYQTYDNSMAEPLPVGSPVMIRPRVTDWLLFQNLNDAIRSLSSPTHGLYRQASWQDNSPGVWDEYPIPETAKNMTNLIRVSVKEYGGSDGWWQIPPNSVHWQPEHGIVRITGHHSLRGRTVQFDYKAPFLTATNLTDDVVDDLGLAETMVDIPPMGAAVSLLRTTESRRNQIHAQGDPRRAEEVGVGANASIARELEQDWKDRIADERGRLINRNPYVRQL